MAKPYPYGGVSAYGDAGSSFTGDSIQYDFNIFPLRVCADGRQPGLWKEMDLVLGGYSGNVIVRPQAFDLTIGGGVSGPDYTVFSSGSASQTNRIQLQNNGLKIMGGDRMRAQAVFLNGGLAYFRRSTSGPGSVSMAGGADSRSGSLTGTLYYAECPTKPGITAVTSSSDGTSAVVNFSPPTDDGGSGITGYRLQQCQSPTFDGPTLKLVDSSGTTTFAGLTPGVNYFYRVLARNEVTDIWGIYGGPWSDIWERRQTLANVGTRFSGGQFVTAQARRFSGGKWVPAKGRRFSSNVWKDVM